MNMSGMATSAFVSLCAPISLSSLKKRQICISVTLRKSCFVGRVVTYPRRTKRTFERARSFRPTASITSGRADELRKSVSPRDNGTLFLCLLCVVGYVVDHMLQFPIMKSLYLHHSKLVPYQLFTSLFCHGSFQHLSSNLFPLLVFGRFVEEESGAFGVVIAFLVCGAMANIASILMMRTAATVSLGASGAVFSLFSLAVLVRFRFRLGRLVEAFILSTYVAGRMRHEFLEAARGSNPYASVQVNHIAHIAGALAGVLLVVLLNLLLRNQNPPSDPKAQLEQQPWP